MRHVTDGSRDAAIVNATISLARAFRLDVIAEGVETAEQLAFLLAHGCREVQGYYFSPPVSADRATELVAKGQFELPQAPRLPPGLSLQSRTNTPRS